MASFTDFRYVVTKEKQFSDYLHRSSVCPNLLVFLLLSFLSCSLSPLFHFVDSVSLLFFILNLHFGTSCTNAFFLSQLGALIWTNFNIFLTRLVAKCQKGCNNAAPSLLAEKVRQSKPSQVYIDILVPQWGQEPSDEVSFTELIFVYCHDRA